MYPQLKRSVSANGICNTDRSRRQLGGGPKLPACRLGDSYMKNKNFYFICDICGAELTQPIPKSKNFNRSTHQMHKNGVRKKAEKIINKIPEQLDFRR